LGVIKASDTSERTTNSQWMALGKEEDTGKWH